MGIGVSDYHEYVNEIFVVFDAELKVGNTGVSHSKELVCSDTRLSHAQVSDSRAVAQAIV